MWPDNQIVFYSLSKTEWHKNLFVANRIQAIQDFNRLSLANWHYCPMASNPTDLLTRGVTLKQLQTSEHLASMERFGNEFSQISSSGRNLNNGSPSQRFPRSSKVIEISRLNCSSLTRTTAYVLRQINNFRLKKETGIEAFWLTRNYSVRAVEIRKFLCF